MKVDKTDLMSQLIETGNKKVSGSKKGASGSQSDTSDFEKMLQQAGQQQGFTAGETTQTTTSAAPSDAAVTGDEPGTVEMELAAALVTSQPVIPVDTLTPVTTEDVVTNVETAEPLMEAAAQTQEAPLPVQQQETRPSVEQPVAEEAPAVQSDEFRPTDRAAEPVAEDRPEEAAESRTDDVAPVEKTDDSQPEAAVEDASAAAEAPAFGQVENVPVKVAETGAPVEAEADDAAEQIAQRVQQAIAQGESKVEITLTPESLGQLTVEITRSGDGTLNIVLGTMTEKAANLLDRHAVSLQHLLADQNFAEVHVEIQRTQEPTAQQFLNPDGQSNHQHREQQQQRQPKEEARDSGDFLQQLRLGLVGLD